MLHQYALPPGGAAAARVIEAAPGRFAPGHVGALTGFLPVELVDAVLEETGSLQRRLRDLPSRVGVYFLLAMCLFPEIGHGLVWRKLSAGLAGRPAPAPSAKALRDLRRRLGSAPMRRLCEILGGGGGAELQVRLRDRLLAPTEPALPMTWARSCCPRRPSGSWWPRWCPPRTIRGGRCG
ncbi:hypothetical protein GCM10010430_50860 [Kitasatospora cystarginea]|uniref:Transposase IS4 N-terminal domain-containing protein n=1 Tax=Kitasatospora cystarginea TaxID=58350 RepID=A0ABP5RGS5_9ACTN